MKVLLTGGTGFVGKALARALTERGHRVRLLVRHAAGRIPGSLPGYEIFNGDVLDTNSCLRACEGCDAVVHLVGIIREFPSRGITFRELHTTATRNLVDAATEQGVGRFIHMSALGAREGAVAQYHKTKFAAEQIVSNSSLGWTVFRPSVIFGFGDEFTRMLVDLASREVVPLIGRGRSLLQPVAMQDVCRCMASSLVMPHSRSRIYELGGPEEISFRDIIEMIASHLGIKVRTVPVPAFLIKPIVMFMERFPAFPLTSDQLTMLCEDNVCDHSPAEETFGFKFTSFLQFLPSLLEQQENRVS